LLRLFENSTGLTISVALVGVVMLQMIDRFVFGGDLQLAWTEEIARILLVWLTFWGAILVQAEDSHFRFELLTDRLPPKWHNVAFIFIDFIVLAFLLIVILSGAVYALHEMNMTLPATGWPRSVYVIAVVVGSLLMAVHITYGLLMKIRQLSSTK
jgi:TRAP-type C4-dicarboxylate transport system permease small subunit